MSTIGIEDMKGLREVSYREPTVWPQDRPDHPEELHVSRTSPYFNARHRVDAPFRCAD